MSSPPEVPEPQPATTAYLARTAPLPPQAQAQADELVYFYAADHDAAIESLQPPIGEPGD